MSEEQSTQKDDAAPAPNHHGFAELAAKVDQALVAAADSSKAAKKATAAAKKATNHADLSLNAWGYHHVDQAIGSGGVLDLDVGAFRAVQPILRSGSAYHISVDADPAAGTVSLRASALVHLSGYYIVR